jgi:hypothetical protein
LKGNKKREIKIKIEQAGKTVMRRLTKEDILQGSNKKEVLELKDYDAEVVIHPLTDGELSRIFSIIGPVPVTPDGIPDLSKVELDKNFEALRLAASLGLVEPKLDVDEVAKMKFGVPEFIGMRVLEISGVLPPEVAKKKDVK